MGSIGLYRDRGQTDRDFFASELGEAYDILDSHSTFAVFYAAVRTKASGEVWALVSPKSWSRDGYFVYKEQDETMGPGDADCPVRIVNLLSPTDSKYANEWRTECRKRAAYLVQERERRKALRVGDQVRFEGSTVDDRVFTLVEHRGKLFANEGLFGRTYKLPAVTARVKVRKVEVVVA